MSTSAVDASKVNTGLDTAVANAGQAMSNIMGVVQQNNAYSAQQAQELRHWQEQQNQKAMEFNAKEAAKNRDWQKMMSDTAHQREIADLLAAGLNPVLSVTGGNGAAVTSGATASGVTSAGAKGDADFSGSSAMVSLLGSLLQQQSQLVSANTNAISNLAVADKYTAMSKYTSELQAETQLSAANISAMATKYSADAHADATKVASAINAAASRYGTDVSSMTQKQIAEFNAEVNKELRQMDITANFDLQDDKYGYEAMLRQVGLGSGQSDIAQIAGMLAGNLHDTFSGAGSYVRKSLTSAKDLFTRGGSFSANGVRR